MSQSSVDSDNQLQLLHPDGWVKAVALLQVDGGFGVRFTGMSADQMAAISNNLAATKAYVKSLSETDFDALLAQIVDSLGDSTVGAPSSDEDEAPINGRLVRISQRLTSLLTVVQPIGAKVDALTNATNARSPAGTPAMVSELVGFSAETQFVLPAGTKKFFLKCRQGKTDPKDILYYSWQPNLALSQTGDADGSFDTLPSGSVLAEESISVPSNRPLFVCTKSIASVPVVLGYWV